MAHTLHGVLKFLILLIFLQNPEIYVRTCKQQSIAIESKMLINSVMYTIAVSLVAKRVQKDKEYQLSKVVTA